MHLLFPLFDSIIHHAFVLAAGAEVVIVLVQE